MATSLLGRALRQSLRRYQTFVVDDSRRNCWTLSDAGIVSHNVTPIYQLIVGLEVHAQLETETKLFSTALSKSSMKPNSHVELFDVAVPGSLPRLSAVAVQQAVRAAVALQCHIPTTSRFERKHYWYADNPAGYQITQQRWPLALNGRLDNTTRIARIQLEQDTAKTLQSQQQSWVDFDRAGCALIEIVTDPDLRSTSQAVQAVTDLRQILKHIGVCQGEMQWGQLRVDCNVNLECMADGRRSPRIEIKNLNSLQQVEESIQYEALRQAREFDRFHREETRTWHATKQQTVLIRSKENETEYRFLPEPDLPPLMLNETVLGMSLDDFVQSLPELPKASLERMQKQYGLSLYQAQVLMIDPSAINFFDAVMVGQPCSLASIAIKLLLNEVFALVKTGDVETSLVESPVSPEQVRDVALMVMEGSLSVTMAKNLLAALWKDGGDARTKAHEGGFQLMSNPQQLQEICREIVIYHPVELDAYRNGGKFVRKIQKVFMGKIMAATKGNSHPERLQEALEKVLQELAPEVNRK